MPAGPPPTAMKASKTSQKWQISMYWACTLATKFCVMWSTVDPLLGIMGVDRPVIPPNDEPTVLGSAGRRVPSTRSRIADCWVAAAGSIAASNADRETKVPRPL
jgi:hypothetical protein